MNPYQHEFATTVAALKLNREQDAERNLPEAAALEPDLSSIHLAFCNLLLKQERFEELITYIADRAEQGQPSAIQLVACGEPQCLGGLRFGKQRI